MHFIHTANPTIRLRRDLGIWEI